VAAAVGRLLDALPLPRGERRRVDLAGTPRRVAEAWVDDLLDGYGADPGAILAGSLPARGRDLVAVTGIDYHSVCPHHLLPSRGLAHVAYLPDGRVAGFGQIARLVDCFAHRLALQEDVARSVAEALERHLGAKGAAVVLDAEQACLSVRGERRRGARAHAQCFTGAMETDADLRRRFLCLVPGPFDSGRPPQARGSRRSGRTGKGPGPRPRTGREPR
jgi:GTP cyclohydrolase I